MPTVEDWPAGSRAQPGTAPDQQAHLRDALTAESDRLEQLNQDAALGRITGFALESAGSDTQIGRYDKQAGIVSLPTASFQPAGTAARADLQSAIELQSMSVAFAQPASPDLANQSHVRRTNMPDHLQSTLNGSPSHPQQ